MRSIRWSPPVGLLLTVVALLSLVLPFLMLGAVRLFDTALIQDTEHALLAEAAVVGELYRRQIDPAAASVRVAAPYDENLRFAPLTPKLDFSPSAVRPPTKRLGTATVATDSLSILLERVRIRNLAAVRVLDRHGVVVASPQHLAGYSLAHLPEVSAALAGDYAPVLRRRYSDSPAPPLSSLSRAADARVSVAIPIFEDPRARPGEGAAVIGAVYSARTPIEPAKALWAWRRKLYLPVVTSVLVVVLVAGILAFAIRRPLVRLDRYARGVAEGEPVGPFRDTAVEPAEVRALAANVERMRRQLEARADYIREFAANAAHELKTPLTSLRGASELLLEEAMPDAQRRRFLENIQSDALRMNRLVSGMLDLARIESTPPARQTMNLSEMLAGIQERYRRLGREVRIDAPRNAFIWAAPDLIESLMGNLLDNAARHGSGEPIDVAVRIETEAYAIVVRDYGPCLAPGDLDHVFDRFYSTARDGGGTGLGLAIVRAVAEAHGGTVTAEAAPERGARFVVRLPRTRSAGSLST